MRAAEVLRHVLRYERTQAEVFVSSELRASELAHQQGSIKKTGLGEHERFQVSKLQLLRAEGC